jgi:thymidylate synthase (FAD)
MVIVEDDLDALMPNGVKLFEHMLRKTELFTRKCYKSEGKMTDTSHHTFLQAVAQTRRHVGIMEHRVVSVTFVTDRGISHEGVRHRMAAYLQESTRYCDFSDKPGAKGICFILPPWMRQTSPQWSYYIDTLRAYAETYEKYRGLGWPPEQSRYWLPQGVKTEYCATKNFGSWKNFLLKRTAPEAHPQIRQLAIPLLKYFADRIPEFFSDIPRHDIDNFAGVRNVFKHKDQIYSQAKLVINPYYEQVEYDEVKID